MEFYIYAYISKRTGLPYYIGKGKNKRAHKPHGKISVPKDEDRIIIMERNLSEVGALALERFYIRWYGRKDLNTGILLNMTDGGEGFCNLSEEIREKLSNIRKGKKCPWASERNKINPPRKGTQTSEIARKNMSEASKKNPRRYWLGKKRDEETNKKISITKQGKRQSNYKLTEEDVREIRKDTRAYKEIAIEYNIHTSYVSNIKTFRKWKHIQ